MKRNIAYADPPYMGQAKKHYSGEKHCVEVNHDILINTLHEHFDIWALSCSSPSLKYILPLCPADIRVAAWVKPFCSFKPNVNPAYAWEPVIFYGTSLGRDIPTERDWVSANITLKRGLSGVKPREFCFWLFRLLGVTSEDIFTDIFPGSGAVTDCLGEYLQGQHYNISLFPQGALE